MRRFFVVAMILFSGCIVAEPAPTSSPHTEGMVPAATTATTGATMARTDVVASGVLGSNAHKHWANVSAYNPGPRTLGWSKQDCVRSVWTARMSGPPGENLSYRPPYGTIGCPAQTGSMRPGEWINWTLTSATDDCTQGPRCENEWDGRLWNGDHPYAAPAGNYTWTFTFRYFQQPAGTTDPHGTASANGPDVGRKELVFNVTRA